MKCIKCRQEIPEGSNYCNLCGKKQNSKAKPKKRRTKGSGYIRKKGNKYEVRYKNRYLGLCASVNEAEKKIAECKLNDDSLPEYYNNTVKQTFDEWVKEKSKKWTLSVEKNYKGTFKNYFDFIKDMKMRDVKAAHFQTVIDNAAELYSYDVCAKIRTIARGICAQAMKNDLINKNYGDLVTLPPKKQPKKIIFSDEEIEKLWKQKKLFYVKVILVLIYTGLRPGELFTTRLDNINLDEQYMITGIKTDAGINRVVPISNDILSFVKDIMEESKITLLNGICTQDYFGRFEFQTALESCEIDNKELTPYSCRHTFYTLCKKNDIDKALLIKIFGHANESVGTENYYHPQIKEKLEVVNKLHNSKIEGNKP